MSPAEALHLDCRDASNLDVLQNALLKIKPIAKRHTGRSRVDIDTIEQFIRHTASKYAIVPQWVLVDCDAADDSFVYSCTLLRASDRTRLTSVFGRTIYELYAKMAIAMVIEAKKAKEQR